MSANKLSAGGLLAAKWRGEGRQEQIKLPVQIQLLLTQSSLSGAVFLRALHCPSPSASALGRASHAQGSAGFAWLLHPRNQTLAWAGQFVALVCVWESWEEGEGWNGHQGLPRTHLPAAFAVRSPQLLFPPPSCLPLALLGVSFYSCPARPGRTLPVSVSLVTPTPVDADGEVLG